MIKNLKLIAIPIATLIGFGFYFLDLKVEFKRVWAQVQQNVGQYSYVPATVTTGPRWMRDCATISPVADGEATTLFTNAPNDCTVHDVDAILHGFNGTSFDRIRTGIQSSVASTGGLTMISHHSDGGALIFPDIAANIDGMSVSLLPASGNMIFNGATWDRQRNMADGANATGLSAAMIALASGTTGAAGFSRAREVTANALTQTTALGIPVGVSYATWNCTNAPAAAAQATCSQASGGGTVRHVVTSFSMCLFTATAATVPVAQLAVVRDGATGAGTIFHNVAVGSGTIQGAQCYTSPPGFSRIGTAATAMTVEFGAAPPANVLQTVNMTGYSVP